MCGLATGRRGNCNDGRGESPDGGDEEQILQLRRSLREEPGAAPGNEQENDCDDTHIQSSREGRLCEEPRLIISVSSERTYPSTVDANSSTVGMTSLAPHRISKPQKIATKAGNSSIGAANFYSSHVAAEKSINADTEVTQPAAICVSMMIAGANDRNSPVGAIINHCERMAPAPQPAPMSTWTRFGAGHRYR